VTDSGTDDARATTSDPRVDVALERLQDLESLDLPAQLDVFNDLQAALARILDSPEPVEPESALEGDDSALRSPAS
jgi:hypothetical protein